MHTEITPAKAKWAPSQGETAIFMLLLVVIIADMPEPVPFWPHAMGQAPSVGTVMLIVSIILALVHFRGRRSGASR